MPDTIFPNLYRLEVPLPNNALRAVNSYIIKGSERSLVIDAGMNLPECANTLLSALKDLEIPLEQTDFFITHVHADHIGLLQRIVKDGNRVFMKKSRDTFDNLTTLQNMISELFFQNGFPEADLYKAWQTLPGLEAHLWHNFPYQFIDDGFTLEVDEYRFHCIATPGHAPSHICLYDESRQLLISGDHILFDITPNISLTLNTENPLAEYRESLDKIYGLETTTVLPGHRSSKIGKNVHRQRIEQLKQHHDERGDEILSVMDHKDPKNAFTITSLIHWDVPCNSWEEFPPAQKFFATNETLAHLKYLESQALITCRCDSNGHAFYTLK